jgi:DNA-binding beta-propeller fold protein YncE
MRDLAGVLLGAISVFALLTGCATLGQSRIVISNQDESLRRVLRGNQRVHTASETNAVLFASADDLSGYYVFLWSYPRGMFLELVRGGSGIGMCSDNSGNVWLADNTLHHLDKYDHNGNLVQVLPDSFGVPNGCAVDPITGNIAVTHQDSGTVAIFADGSGSGSGYLTSLATGYFCGYDDRGNLFADGINSNNQGQLVQLRKNGLTFTNITLKQRIAGTGAVQWDGKYLAVQAAQGAHTVTIDRIRVAASSGTITFTTQLKSPRTGPAPLAQFWIQGRTILEAIGIKGKEIGLWAYPSGGDPKRLISGAGNYHAYYIKGLTVSVGPSQ